MFSNKSNALWVSQTQNQNGAVNNWSQYKVNMTGSSNKFNIVTANTTSSVLSLYDASNVYGVKLGVGDTVLLSTDGSTLTQGTLGSLTTTFPTTVAPYTGATQSASTNYFPEFPHNHFISADGKNVYTAGAGTSYNGRIYQYALSTAYDFTTISNTYKSWYIGANTYPIVFAFKSDGTVLYVASYSNPTAVTINQFKVSTPWDITTADTTSSGYVTISSPAASKWLSGNGYLFTGSIRFSPDGSKLIVQNYCQNSTSTGDVQLNYAIYNLSSPWNIQTCATSTTNYSNLSYLWNISDYDKKTGTGFYFTPDGYRIFSVARQTYGASSYTYKLYGTLTSLTTPWDLTTASASVNGSSIGDSYTQSYTHVYIWGVNPTGTVTSGIYSTPDYPNLSTYTNYCSTVDFNIKNNFNISSFGLAATPNTAYSAPPTVNVQTASTSSRINMFTNDLFTQSISTSSANVYIPGDGVITTGDLVLLNANTGSPLTATISSVTQGSVGGTAAAYVVTANNYLNKTFTTMGSSSYMMNFRLSPDGTKLICCHYGGPYGSGLYTYNLSVPWDISTASYANNCVVFSTEYTNTGAFDISPDGTRLVTYGLYLSGQSASGSYCLVREYLLRTPWDISSLTPSGATVSGQGISTASCQDVRWTPNGSQLIITTYTSNSGQLNIDYFTCGTPYTLSTAGSITNKWYSASSSTGTVNFTPDGSSWILNGYITTQNSITSANNFATSTNTNALNTNKWYWPASFGNLSYTFCSVISPDGTKMYVNSADKNYPVIYQFNVYATATTKYTLNFPTQLAAPTLISIPDRSAQQTVNTTLSGNNMVWTTTTQSANARSLAVKVVSPITNCNVSTLSLSMWHQ